MIYDELKKLASSKKAAALQRFFKTGKGEYGEGDKFLGVMVPNTRKIAQKYPNLSFHQINKILKSQFHEVRLCALLILKNRFLKSDDAVKKVIHNLYLSNTKHINNWDLIDLTAPTILGGFLENKNRSPLYNLVRSTNLWERRMSIISTAYYINKHDFTDTIKISKILLNDKHDLIHKAVGWMLREVGKKSLQSELKFLQKYYKVMPRTMLRYAIEKFPDRLRVKFLRK